MRHTKKEAVIAWLFSMVALSVMIAVMLKIGQENMYWVYVTSAIAGFPIGWLFSLAYRGAESKKGRRVRIYLDGELIADNLYPVVPGNSSPLEKAIDKYCKELEKEEMARKKLNELLRKGYSLPPKGAKMPKEPTPAPPKVKK